ncbi:hypothetical protein BZA77DRAFT_354326 [Pyronema omphalodes]|nr:hypothetical protein BZA77DRAFT_354326 [Pyronema omphalodes]
MQFSIFAASMIFSTTAFSAVVPPQIPSGFDLPEGMEILPAGSFDATNVFGKRTSWSDCYVTACNEKCKQDFEIRLAAYCSPFNHGIKAVCCPKQA